jgi:hypothetical protein
MKTTKDDKSKASQEELKPQSIGTEHSHEAHTAERARELHGSGENSPDRKSIAMTHKANSPPKAATQITTKGKRRKGPIASPRGEREITTRRTHMTSQPSRET